MGNDRDDGTGACGVAVDLAGITFVADNAVNLYFRSDVENDEEIGAIRDFTPG